MKKSLSVILGTSLLLTGCYSVGPRQLKATQVDYARALGEAKKRQILATMVGLRFADAPVFLTASQLIVGYDLTTSANPSIATRPGLEGAALQASAGISVAYSSHPTFTFTPATGEAYARFIRPLSPTLILPLASSQTPIDLLLRVTTQSIGPLQNSTMLGGPEGNGSPEFFELLALLRRLQVTGELTVEYREVNEIPQVSIALAEPTDDSPTSRDLTRARELLGLRNQTSPYPVIYTEKTAATNAGSIRLATRSVLGILGNLGAEVQVSADDVQSGATKRTIELVGGEARPTIIVHSGAKAPSDAYVAVSYQSRDYWIDRMDFDSKYAFTIVQDLMALAESGDSARPPVVTIGAN